MPLGDKPWLNGVTPAFASHPLYILDPPAQAIDPETQLPVYSAPPAPVLVTPAPRVRVGAQMEVGEGGALVQVGDAKVTNLPRASWPRDRLVDAVGFLLDSTGGELYQLAGETLEEAGPATWSFCLRRMSQPRATSP